MVFCGCKYDRLLIPLDYALQNVKQQCHLVLGLAFKECHLQILRQLVFKIQARKKENLLNYEKLLYIWCFAVAKTHFS